jgi:hypothetical protein
MMISEKVRITVEFNGKKYQQITNVVSDGAYHNVCNEIKKIIDSAWINKKITSYCWSYIS